MLNYITKNKKIGVAKIGGAGDTIQLLFLIHALRRKYSDYSITAYVRDRNEYIIRDPAIDRIVFTGYCDWNKLVKKEAPKYDLFFDDRYIVGKWVKGKLKVKNENIYWNFFDYLNSFKGNLLEMSARGMGVKLIDSDYNLDFLIENDKLERLMFEPYIILHTGDDEVRKTKAYPIEYWNELVKLLKNQYSDTPLIQVGTKEETKIIEVVDLRGKTNFEELCGLIRGAILIITTEGLLPHLAKAFGVKAVVLFSATSKENFGYKENINIEGKLHCKNCWYTTDTWYKECPLTKEKRCYNMFTILPEEIFSQIKSYL